MFLYCSVGVSSNIIIQVVLGAGELLQSNVLIWLSIWVGLRVEVLTCSIRENG